MEIIKNREIVQDGFTHLSDEDALPDHGDVTVSATRFAAERDALLARNGKVGVRLSPADEPAAIADHLGALALVAIEFPKFTDGRGYTSARELRGKYGYGGELRAVGHVLRDQLFYMARVGIDAFELAPGKSLQDALHAFEEFSVTYQAAADDQRPLYRRGLR